MNGGPGKPGPPLFLAEHSTLSPCPTQGDALDSPLLKEARLMRRLGLCVLLLAGVVLPSLLAFPREVRLPRGATTLSSYGSSLPTSRSPPILPPRPWPRSRGHSRSTPTASPSTGSPSPAPTPSGAPPDSAR